jgi:hypothetical protein
MSILILNAILAIAVVGVLLPLLSWAIIRSRKEQLAVTIESRQRAPGGYGHRPHAPHPHWPTAGRPQPRRDHSEPVAG